MKAIIIAAGQGSRLRPYTDDRAKCMVEVGGAPMLHHQLAAFKACGVDDVVVIRGYKARSVVAPGARFVRNADFMNNNILMSLFCAGPELVGDVIISYGDIVYHPSLLEHLLDTQGPATLVLDEGWQATYEGRSDHPVEQAELAVVSSFGLVTEVGKHVGPSDKDMFGEFIGMARLSAPFVGRMWVHYLNALRRGIDAPIGKASSLRSAYLTDLLNVMMDAGESIGVLGTEGGWREIDTVQDLERAGNPPWAAAK